MIDLLGLSQMFVEVSDKILPLFASRNHKTKTQSNFFIKCHVQEQVLCIAFTY